MRYLRSTCEGDHGFTYDKWTVTPSLCRKVFSLKIGSNLKTLFTLLLLSLVS